MFLSAGRIFLVALGSVGLALMAPAGAQTLHQRPPAPPVPPSAPAAVQPAEPVPAQPPTVLPKGTSLQVEIVQHYPMKAGEIIEGQLMHPIYAEGKLAVPENTRLRGRVVTLAADRKTRWQGRLHGDFTPFHKPEVRFDEIELISGSLPIDADAAADGAPAVHLTAPGAVRHASFFARHWDQAKTQLHDRVAFFTAPGKGDRALQILYHQLPYHPERIAAHTSWSFELAEPLTLPSLPEDPQPAPATIAASKSPEVWSIQAELSALLTSATAKPGDSVQALVVEPVYDRSRQLVVPEGSMLIGKVTTAKAAHSLGRNGKLRFAFQQVRFPAGTPRSVQGSLAGASVDKSQDLALDAEGTVTPRNKSSVIAPMLLTMLAGRALDQDGNMTTQTGVASNGFGLVGRIVGVAAGNRNFAAGLGFYAAGISFYENFLQSGRDVIFPKDTRIDIETTPLRAPVLKP